LERVDLELIKRIFDITISLFIIIIIAIPCIFIWFMVKLTSSGPGIYWSRRAGRQGTFFMMPKFRTMHTETPEVATDKLSCSELYMTPIGLFLRKTSLDELPQFFTVLTGKMSIVGPRPALHNQCELINKRKKLGIDTLRPGITGWAQINGRDDIKLSEKIIFDNDYLKYHSFLFDLRIIIRTISLVLIRKNTIY